MYEPKDLIPAEEARAILGVSTWKMATLLREGILRHFSSPLDRRKKLVSRAEVEALKHTYREAA
jgi:hypothetical protein